MNIDLRPTTNAISARVVFSDDDPGLAVHSLRARFHLSELFTITLETEAVGGHVDLESLVYRTVTVFLPDGTPLCGLVASAETTAGRDDARWLTLQVVPRAWLRTTYFDQWIAESKDLLEVTKYLVEWDDMPGSTVRSELAPPPEPREYTTQFDETDWDLLLRLWAEEGITTFFDSSADEELLVLTNDTTRSCQTRDVFVRFKASEGAAHEGPVITHVRTSARMPLHEAGLLDDWFLQPNLSPRGRVTLADPAASGYWVSRVGVGATQAILDRRARAMSYAGNAQRTGVELRGTAIVLPGSRLNVEGSPIPEADVPLLVVSLEIVWNKHERQSVLRCIPAARPFAPERRPKPKIGGLHSGWVIGDGEIDVDEHGRVLVEFPWDQGGEEPVRRRVRVSQGWAGPGYGFVCHPRVNDAVMVAYLDGDPDEPIVVGRVFDGENVAPVPLPAAKTISYWRSRSTPDSEGYNEIFMDDQAGEERLVVRAERDFSQTVQRNLDAYIGKDVTIAIDGDKTVRVKGHGDVAFQSPCELRGPQCAVTAEHLLALKSSTTTIEAFTRADTSTTYIHHANLATFVIDGLYCVKAGAIRLVAGGSSITITDGSIDIKSSGPVNINGAPINLNC